MRKKITRVEEVLIFGNGLDCVESITDNNVKFVLFVLEINYLDANRLGLCEWLRQRVYGLVGKVGNG
jgi:hypothetical protein